PPHALAARPAQTRYRAAARRPPLAALAASTQRTGRRTGGTDQGRPLARTKSALSSERQRGTVAAVGDGHRQPVRPEKHLPPARRPPVEEQPRGLADPLAQPQSR